MITTILSILGVVFLIWIAIVFIWNLIIRIIYKYTDDCKYTYLKRSTVIYMILNIVSGTLFLLLVFILIVYANIQHLSLYGLNGNL